MLADILGSGAAIFTIVGGALGVGAAGVGFGRWWTHRRIAREQTAIIAALPTADHQLLCTLDMALSGEEASRLNPHPSPGLVERVGKLEEGHREIVKMLRPNGGKTTDPGDMLQKVSQQNEAIMAHLGIELDK